MRFPRRDLDGADRRRHVDVLFERARTFVRAVGYVFAAVFTAFQIKNLTIIPLLATIEPEFFVRLGLIIYYNSWVFSVSVESKMAQKVYATDPNKGKTPVSMFLILPLLIGIGLLLFWVSSSMKLLSLALAAFLVVDVTQWFVFKSLARPLAASSTKIYREEHRYSQLEQLRCYVEDHLKGMWQPFRFGAMFFILLLFLVASHSDALRSLSSQQLASFAPALTAQKIDSLISPILFLTYIIVAEGWVWAMRLATKRRIDAIDEIDSMYALVPRAVMAPVKRRTRRQRSSSIPKNTGLEQGLP
jgi:hypothetical protein